MAEKPFFDADQAQIKYRLNQLAADLADYPYLAIWLGLNDLRVDSMEKSFPTTAAMFRAVRHWSDYIANAFEFFALETQNG